MYITQLEQKLLTVHMNTNPPSSSWYPTARICPSLLLAALILLFKTENLDLLLHLPDLELVRTRVAIVGHLVLGLLRRDRLDLVDDALHASATALAASSSCSCVLDMSAVLTRDAATNCVVAAATSFEGMMSCSSMCVPLRTPSAAWMSHVVASATARGRDKPFRPAVVASVELLHRARPISPAWRSPAAMPWQPE